MACRRTISNTRKKLECDIFGSPSEIPRATLPTYYDVMKYYLWVRNNIKPKNCSKEPTIADVSEIVANDIEALWKKASIPTVTHTRVLQLIRCYHDKYTALLKYPINKRNQNYKVKTEVFRKDSKKLFDIASCKCTLLSSCSCGKPFRIPVQEHEFLTDQRGPRTMIIGGVDVVETRMLKKREKRKVRGEGYKASQQKKLSELQGVEVNAEEMISSASDQEDVPLQAPVYSDEGVLLDALGPQPASRNKYNLGRMNVALPTVARICDQYGISDRSAAAVASAVLQDIGIITADEKSMIIDKNKIRRARTSCRNKQRVEGCLRSSKIEGLYFDARKDKTFIQYKVSTKYYRRIVVEEHISLIQEPGSKYVGHVVPATGSAANIMKSMLDFFEESDIDLSSLMAVGCDGTAVNTGRRNELIRQLEVCLGRSLQWFICQLHGIELLLRHLFQELNGKTKGPNDFSGPIGKILQSCEQTEPVPFQKINCILPEIESKELSTDQKYLYDMCLAISSGECPPELAHRDPGKTSHARWLTTANRLLRLYAGTPDPTENLPTLAEFILKVYAPVWFTVKLNSSCKDGARNVYKTVQSSRYLSDTMKQIIDPVISRNAFFCHPENLLLAMITDDRKHIRELGLRRILKARQTRRSAIRDFSIPQLNFEAADYTDLIQWADVEVTEPSVTSQIAEEDLIRFISDEHTPHADFPKFPCHSQAVERCVKLVTEACHSVVGPSAREGFIHSRIRSRNIMSRFESKKDFPVV